ncbi:MAG: FkbM family methyltransferase [Cyclobacteriaceae bacterium]|nr:FkbM family methyltransferase [Cyclobacteriaceae bacterium]MDH5248585.1 FkbM family methyltransferase [Cyclobacteriaceae bacterium]
MKSSFVERLTSKKKRLNQLKDKVIAYYSSLPQTDLPDDQKTIISFLRENDISIFPYPFPAKYHASDIELHKDDKLNLHYMLWEGKKLYYKSGNRPKKAQEYFNSLRLEQDIRSPHRYLTRDFDVAENDVVVDVGAAEGNFSLSVIEKAGYVYLFETDKKWIKALNATFAPWSNKVKIIQKYVAEETADDKIALDDFFDDQRTINFIKADVEGAEALVLKGAANSIARQHNLKIAVCTYHRQEDAALLDEVLKTMGFHNTFSDGYMLYYYGRSNVVKEPFLRKAILRGVKVS